MEAAAYIHERYFRIPARAVYAARESAPFPPPIIPMEARK
jgi:hypothetical protein